MIINKALTIGTVPNQFHTFQTTSVLLLNKENYLG